MPITQACIDARRKRHPKKTDAQWMAYMFKNCKVDENGCWVWQKFRHAKGYGGTYFRGRTDRTHRVMWMLVNGEIPKGKLVCHTCDNPPCCNPDHLWLGTIWENGQDAKRKGRCKYQKTTACKNGHPWIEGNYRLTKDGFKACKICARINQRVRSGWPRDLATTLPAQKPGYSPLRT